jgi:hypothetical protein
LLYRVGKRVPARTGEAWTSHEVRWFFDPRSESSQAACRWSESIIELRTWNGTENGSEKDGSRLGFCGAKNGAGTSASSPKSSSIGSAFHGILIPKKNNKSLTKRQRDIVYEKSTQLVKEKKESRYYTNPFDSPRLVAYAVDPTSSSWITILGYFLDSPFHPSNGWWVMQELIG